MHYHDPVYGDVEIDEPVILDIISCPSFQRLKWIDQSWYFEPFYPWCSFKRFEHSVGVYLLLKAYGAPIDEQIAWLIHDISHGTFSHCLDYVFDEGDQKKQDHQDAIFNEFVMQTEIPDILVKHSINIYAVLDEPTHPLKENDLPDLCADRIDYSLRTMVHFDKLPVDSILGHLKAKNATRYFDELEAAKTFAEMFKRINDVYFSGIESAIMFQTVADLCRHARKSWYVEKEDFYTTDDQVLTKIKLHIDRDPQLELYRQRMNNVIGCSHSPEDFDTRIFCKNRVTDPLVEANGELVRLSALDTAWKETIHGTHAPKEYFLKFDR